MGMVLAVAFNVLDLALASIAAAGALILSGSISVDDAYETIDLKTLLLMVGMLPMSTALQKVGLVDAFCAGVRGYFGAGWPIDCACGDVCPHRDVNASTFKYCNDSIVSAAGLDNRAQFGRSATGICDGGCGRFVDGVRDSIGLTGEHISDELG